MRSAFGRRAEPERSEGGWSEAQRSGAKWRGRGLGQRNTFLKKICVINQKFKNLRVFRQSPFARKALCTTGRAGPLACAAAAVYSAIHKPRPAAAHHLLSQKNLQFPICCLKTVNMYPTVFGAQLAFQALNRPQFAFFNKVFTIIPQLNIILAMHVHGFPHAVC